MSGIKKGALVKAWSDSLTNYSIGLYFRGTTGRHHVVDLLTGDMLSVKNAIEIPQELVAQLEALGSYE